MIDEALRLLIQQQMEQHRLPAEFMQTVEQYYLPIAGHIAAAQQHKQETLLVSFNGSQGSGKSTMTAFLSQILTHHFDKFTVQISIDDFYLTRADRQQLAKSVHPLFATRGVPGTHDVALANQTLSCLRLCSEYHSCQLPVFDKATDDRVPVKKWPRIDQEVRVILFEGWCNHAPVEAAEKLVHPVNDLERIEDAEGVWRRYANAQLEYYHKVLFAEADLLVFLQVPSFEKVFEWRGLQEQKLEQQAGSDKSGLMTPQQLSRFIQHYERITRSCLATLPGQADVVVKLDEDHGITGVDIRET